MNDVVALFSAYVVILFVAVVVLGARIIHRLEDIQKQIDAAKELIDRPEVKK